MAETMEWEETTIVDDPEKCKASRFSITAQNVMDIILMDVEMEYVEEDSKRRVIVVADTNIFIHSIQVVRRLMDKQNVDFQDPNVILTVVLPWTVLQELDGLRKRNRDAQAAINYINTLLVEKHPYLRPQRPSELSISKEEFPGSNEDDSILQCVLQWCGKIVDGKIVFITNDKNLRSKALVADRNNLIICDGESALPKVLSLYRTTASGNQSQGEQISTNNNGSGRTRLRSSSLRRELVVRPIPDTCTSSIPETCRKRKTSISTPASIPGSPMFSPLRKKIPARIPSAVQCKNFSQMQHVLRDTISYIIEFQMKEDFGDNWRKCLKIPPPWTLESGLKCLLAHWIAVFSFVFGRRKKDAEKLHELVRMYNKGLPKDGKRDEIEEDILESFVALINDAELNKSQIVKEPQFVHCKKTLLEYIQNSKKGAAI